MPAMPNPSNPPTGTLTFLFTDIEGSTTRWEHFPSQMQAALTRHDALLRHAIEAHGGHVFKTVGDAFCAAFPSPYDALQAALAAQRSLHSEDWSAFFAPQAGTGTDHSLLSPQSSLLIRVRMALHTGAVEEQGGDYFGQPLNRVARLLSTGHGGQTLLSLATQELVRDNLPQGVELKDMGEHRLKDLIRPEHIYQLLAPDLPSEFPPLKTLDYRPNNLPRQPTALIGREKETAQVAALLRNPDVALVTLTGPGGTGKTRLALQAAADVLDDFAGGVYFVELAALTDPALVASTIAQTLGVTEQAGKPLEDSVKDFLKEKRMLLLLDNFEQVMDASPLLPSLLKPSPNLKVLVTSRVPLRVYGERAYQVPALQVPDPRQLSNMTPRRLSQYEAVRLFIERAQAVKSDFEVTNDNAPSVAEICARLDGLPLAIELAAARIRLFPPQALLTRLSNSLRLLTGGPRDLPARQQTLRGAIDWSYDLLDEGEQQLFRRLAVFQGGRTFEAIEAVCNAPTPTPLPPLAVDVLDGVSSLVDKSLLRQEEGAGGEPRFVMLETIHEYAREKLDESRPPFTEGEADALQRQHALYFMALAEEAEPHLVGAEQLAWAKRLDEEHDNFRAALGWAERMGEVEIGLRLAAALHWFWQLRGHWSEGRDTLERLLEKAGPALSPELQAKALDGVGALAFRQADRGRAHEVYEQSLAIYRQLGNKRGQVEALRVLGLLAASTDNSLSDALFAEGLALAREIGDKRSIANILRVQADNAWAVADYQSARALYRESIALFREVGDKERLAVVSINYGGVLFIYDEDYPAARALYREVLEIAGELEDKWNFLQAVYFLGQIAMYEGDYPAARPLFEQALALAQELGTGHLLADSHLMITMLTHCEGKYDEARTLCEESLLLCERVDSSLRGLSLSIAHAELARIAIHQGDYRLAAKALRESAATADTSTYKEILAGSLAGFASLAAVRGDAERATRLWSVVDATISGRLTMLSAPARLDYPPELTALKASLTPQAFAAAWAEGRALTLDQAVTYALEQSDG